MPDFDFLVIGGGSGGVRAAHGSKAEGHHRHPPLPGRGILQPRLSALNLD